MSKHRLGLSAGLLCALLASSCSVVVNTKDRDACSTHKECTERYGEPSACVASECKKLLTAECTEVYPPNALLQDDTLLIGFEGALAGEFASYGTPPKEGVELALSEMTGGANSLPPSTGSNAARHLAMLVCDHGSDPSVVARHLVENANVPVIIGDSFSSATLQLFDDVARSAGVLVLSPSATSPALTDHDDDGLLWRTSPSDVVQTELLKLLVQDVEAALHRTGVLAEGERARIAMPTKDDSAGQGLANAIRATNTSSPSPAESPKVGLSLTYPNPSDGPVEWQRYIDQIIDYEPHIILAMGTGEFVTSMMQGIEDDWNPDAPRPWYLLPEGDRVSELSDLVSKNSKYALQERIVGTAPGARRSRLYQSFAGRFQSKFTPRLPGNLAEFGYDAAYLVGYALAITDQVAPDGRSLADALKKMTCATPLVPAGPDNFYSDFKVAASTGCINFDGVSGPLEFDSDHGEALSDIAMWCLRSGRKGSFGFEPTLASYYQAETGVLVESDPALDLSTPGWCDAAPSP